jgi:uncharacterized damage-inducible protein DinB
MSNTSSSSDVEPLDRVWPDQVATDELRLLREWLDFLRITAVNKLAGLTREQAAATPWPTSPHMSILGVLKHLTAVERFWISIVGGGSHLPMLWENDDVNAEWRLSEHDTPAAVTDAYRAEWVLSAKALDGKAADDLAARPVKEEQRTVRWILTHVVQETARHVGHMDVLREFADGSVGE